MSRTTIDFGIDLGTTNSAIAVLKGVTTEIIKNSVDADITPSAVGYDKKGGVNVGYRGKNMMEAAKEDAFIEFKRRMGTNHVYHFESSGIDRKPEELSAEVLKALRAEVQGRTGELVEACVITVPAAFELHQCNATLAAAKLAGFRQCPLLQEPVAAALAHGFQIDQENAYWLVYDFGGGTFDAALMKAEDGTIHVANHGGDNYLGGSDIDWALIDSLIVPSILQQYKLKDFTRGNRQWRSAFARLKRVVEMGKIELSRKERTMLEDCRFMGSNGEEIELEIELTRNEVMRAAEPLILKSAEICKKVLKEKSLGRDAIARVILVGGPTLAPYFREMLQDALGMPLDNSMDALTVVARGAAVFAGAQRINATTAAPVAAGEFAIDLKYKPVGADEDPMVGGKVSAPNTSDFTGFSLEFVNSKTQWRSARLAVRADGVFIATLHAERGDRNIFTIELSDASGRKQKTTPNALSYTIGAVVEEQNLAITIGIALATNEYSRLFEKGQGLPKKVTREYRTVHALRQGQNGELIKIPIVQGENTLADRNRYIDVVPIEAKNIRRDLPAGSEVEVTLRISESQEITVTAFVPLLDEEFSRTIKLVQRSANADFLRKDLQNELKRFQEAKNKADAADSNELDQAIEAVERSALLNEVEALAKRADGNPDEAAKLERRLLELKAEFDRVDNALEWPALMAEARDWLRDLADAVRGECTPEQRKRTTAIEEEVNDIITDRNAEGLRRKLTDVSRLYFEIVFTRPSFWVNQLAYWDKRQDQMRDRARGARLIEQGRDCIAKNNINGLQNIVRQIWDLLPRESVDTAQRGYQSGLVK